MRQREQILSMILGKHLDKGHFEFNMHHEPYWKADDYHLTVFLAKDTIRFHVATVDSFGQTHSICREEFLLADPDSIQQIRELVHYYTKPNRLKEFLVTSALIAITLTWTWLLVDHAKS